MQNVILLWGAIPSRERPRDTQVGEGAPGDIKILPADVCMYVFTGSVQVIHALHI